MEIQETLQGAVLVLRPVGALVEADAAEFRTRAGDAASRSLGRMCVDAAGVPYVDSTALEALVELTERLAEGGRALKLCSVTQTVREVLEVTGWIDSFEVYDDVPSAARSFL